VILILYQKRHMAEQLAWSLAVCVLFLLALTAFCIFITVHRYKRTNGKEWEFHDGLQYIIGSSVTSFSSNAIFGYRLILVLFVLAVHFFTVGDTMGVGYIYFTVWNFVLLGIYFSLALYFHFRVYFNPNFGQEMDKTFNLGLLGNIFVVVFHILATEVFLVDIVYWVELYDGSQIGMSTVTQHAVNFGIFMIDFVLNRLVLSWTVLPLVLLWPVLYGYWAIFYHGVGGGWTYDFISTNKSTAIGWYVGLFIFHVILFGIAYGLSVLKKSFLLKPVSKAAPNSPTRPTELNQSTEMTSNV